MVVYLDAVFLLNYLVDFLLLQSADRLAGYRTSHIRLMMGALIGSVYGAFSLLPGFRFLGWDFWRVVMLITMAVVCFGVDFSAFRRGCLFTLLSMALGGAASASMAKDATGFFCCCALLWILCRVSFGTGIGVREFAVVELYYGEKSVRIKALKDTGNGLRDPITGEQVLIASAEIGAQLLGIGEDELKDPVHLVMSGKVPGLRLIPFSSVGMPKGLLPVIRMRGIKVNTTYTDALIGFSPSKIGIGDGYQMLAGGNIG